jgi:hypothetical protein
LDLWGENDPALSWRRGADVVETVKLLEELVWNYTISLDFVQGSLVGVHAGDEVWYVNAGLLMTK